MLLNGIVTCNMLFNDGVTCIVLLNGIVTCNMLFNDGVTCIVLLNGGNVNFNYVT